MYLKIKFGKLAVCIAIPLAIGGLAGLLTRGSMEDFAKLTKPPLSPPGWIFPVVWTILFVLMGIATYLVVDSGAPKKTVDRALALFGVQLGFNFFWSIFFFNMELYLFSFIWLVVLWALIAATAASYYRISRPAGYLLLPYFLWTAFAGYLNFGIYMLN